MAIQSPSLANVNLLDLGQRIKELSEAGIGMLHIDIMDGHYVPALCLPPGIVRDIRRDYHDMILDVHMMVDNPEAYIDMLADFGADYISFHADSTSFVRKLIGKIQNKGVKAGVVLNPSQSIEVIEPYARYLDYVTFMAVEPGVSGQLCLDGMVERLRKLAVFRKENNLHFEIFVDGGMSYGVIESCIESGADVIITGVYAIFNQPDGIMGAAKRFNEVAGKIKSNLSAD